MITQKDSLAFLKEQKDFAFDINYSDPPYALGSEIYIRPDGKFDYKKETKAKTKKEEKPKKKPNEQLKLL